MSRSIADNKLVNDVFNFRAVLANHPDKDDPVFQKLINHRVKP